MSTNNHDDFYKIAKLTPLETNNFTYGYIRLFNNLQVFFYNDIELMNSVVHQK